MWRFLFSCFAVMLMVAGCLATIDSCTEKRHAQLRRESYWVVSTFKTPTGDIITSTNLECCGRPYLNSGLNSGAEYWSFRNDYCGCNYPRDDKGGFEIHPSCILVSFERK